jgi:hypothetical protein
MGTPERVGSILARYGWVDKGMVTMRIPNDPMQPTFDQTFRVGFWAWLTSSADDRREWARRRNVAANTARLNQNTQVGEWADRKRRERETP